MMGDLLGWFGLTDHAALGVMMALGYPALAIAALEGARALGPRRALAATSLRQVTYLVLPTGAIWLILRVLAGLPSEHWATRGAETAFALTGLYLLLRLVQGLLMMLLDERTQAPKLLLDVVRIGFSLLWGAVIISNIWHVDLGSLFAAMGVGSIVLAFALQEFLGNLLSGLGLLTAHKFGIGDWIVVDGGPARVVEMDWRTVTLAKGDVSVVVANSTLAKGSLVLAARAESNTTITLALNLGLDIPPEQVREAVLEAARTLPALPGDPAVQCWVTGMTDSAVSYAVLLPVANPINVSGRRNEFLTRFWYVAQRRGIRLRALQPMEVIKPADAEARLQMLTAARAFRGAPDELPGLAEASSFRRYRRGDVLLQAGAASRDVLLVLAGKLAVTLCSGHNELRLELVEAGQLLVLHETLAGGASPVQVVAHDSADVLAIPAASLYAMMDRNPAIARDVGALAEARRLAIQPLSRGLHALAGPAVQPAH